MRGLGRAARTGAVAVAALVCGAASGPMGARVDVVGNAARGCPDHSVAVVSRARGVAACVDVFELAVQTANGTAWPFNVALDGLPNGSFVAVPAAGINPQAYISAEQAAAACATSGKRLCTADEWLAACRGPGNTTYPYGNRYEPGWCNEGRATNPVNDVYGPHASFNSSEMNNPVLDTLPRTVAPGGAFSRCRSALGAMDMHGNVHEWVSTRESNGRGQFRGGFFVDAKINGPGCTYVTVAHAPDYHDYSTGARCCSDLTVSRS